LEKVQFIEFIKCFVSHTSSPCTWRRRKVSSDPSWSALAAHSSVKPEQSVVRLGKKFSFRLIRWDSDQTNDTDGAGKDTDESGKNFKNFLAVLTVHHPGSHYSLTGKEIQPWIYPLGSWLYK